VKKYGIDIEAAAKLSRLKLTPDEQERMARDLGSILEYVASLDKLDTKNVEPTSHVLNLENVYRPDEVKKSSARDKVLKYAPASDGFFFKVPKTVSRE
jgi:aspartyl-tRNA(Asn)/glutamyl-tRNA(Gln) amidotransferase subunit C